MITIFMIKVLMLKIIELNLDKNHIISKCLNNNKNKFKVHNMMGNQKILNNNKLLWKILILGFKNQRLTLFNSNQQCLKIINNFIIKIHNYKIIIILNLLIIIIIIIAIIIIIYNKCFKVRII